MRTALPHVWQSPPKLPQTLCGGGRIQTDLCLDFSAMASYAKNLKTAGGSLVHQVDQVYTGNSEISRSAETLWFRRFKGLPV